MKKNILYITLIFALCFGIKTQAQNVIAYETKVSSLSASQAEQVNYLAKGVPTSIFVTEENTSEMYHGDESAVLAMNITKSTDFGKLAADFGNKLAEITIVNIVWDGQQELVLPTGLLDRMPNLKYIYIQSYSELNQSVISTRFPSLMNQLEGRTNVEVLYTTMEQPS
ncbi:hypothetical protein [Myroides odoratus]|uniref:Leucine Rich repeats (2 copies) n=1 Tax=Myroides odoratus TaxID=256 RepID=A0A378RM41_MYROD|nr:hypothetical protein [Myroides odoratus]QQU04459.1 hypothetical protein I6I89_04015 [Myroides odoratus]STZ28112.1 Uncharacterised protein [Myroides odoratus]